MPPVKRYTTLGRAIAAARKVGRRILSRVGWEVFWACPNGRTIPYYCFPEGYVPIRGRSKP